jgi:hypothetical protein
MPKSVVKRSKQLKSEITDFFEFLGVLGGVEMVSSEPICLFS